MKNDHGRGTIRDNALAALVTSKAYQAKIEKPKKGKGSYARKSKHKNSRKYDDYREFFYYLCGLLIRSFTKYYQQCCKSCL